MFFICYIHLFYLLFHAMDWRAYFRIWSSMASFVCQSFLGGNYTQFPLFTLCGLKVYTLYIQINPKEKVTDPVHYTPRCRQTPYLTRFLSITSLCPSQLYCHFLSVKPLVRSKFSILKNMIRKRNKMGS